MKKTILGLLLLLAMFAPSRSNAQVLSNSATAIPVTPGNYSCYPASGAVFPVIMPNTAGCYSLENSGSLATVAATYVNFSVTLSVPVPVGQSVRVDLGDFSTSAFSSFACVIPAGAVSCSAVVSGSNPFSPSAGDVLSVNFNNSTGSQSFIIPSATWTLQ
jgi:hypothetical protein